jgi:hypothetical protein
LAVAAAVAALDPTVTGVTAVRLAAPLFATWMPHAGPGTPLAVAVAATVVSAAGLADRLPWRRLLAATYAASVTWTLALALVDGGRRGLGDRLDSPHEYLAEVPGIGSIAVAVRGFTARIVDFQPDSWTTHVAGHPPGALLVFVGLDRIGLGGGQWAALACVAVFGVVAVAVPVTLRAVGAEPAARAAVPFLVLFPGAVWAGASADGLFAGVAALGLALLAVATTRAGAAAALLAGAAGAVLGFACHLSYGLVLLAPVVLAVLVLGRRTAIGPWCAAGTAAAFAVFAAAGFRWFDGYRLVVERYYQGIAADRPYAYWVWANVACLVLAAGPATVPVLRRAALSVWRSALVGRRRAAAGWLLPLTAAAAMAAADLSGMSRAEVERIWLPFAVWVAAGAGLLPADRRRAWLATQAVTAIALNHLLDTTW